MDTIFDYVKWMGDFSFEDKAFCEIDAMVLSVLSYYDFKLFDSSGSSPLTLRETCRKVASERRLPPPFSARTEVPVKEFLELAA